MRNTARQTRENRTITVDFRSEAIQIPPNLVVGRVRRIPIPSRGEDLQIEHPV